MSHKRTLCQTCQPVLHQMSLQRASTHASRRAFSSASTSRQQTCLVGAPHPVSHLRPVIYSGTRLPASNSKYDEKHPYSLAEFRESTIYSPTAVKGNPKSDVEWELNWRLMENDAKDHAFWVDVSFSHRYTQRFIQTYILVEQHAFQQGEEGDRRRARGPISPSARCTTRGITLDFLQKLGCTRS